MTINYNKLFSINFKHDYYKDGNCPDISVVPDQFSGQLIQKYRLILRASKSGFFVAAKCNNDGTIADSIETNIQLNFQISWSNPYLQNITSLTQTPENHLRLYSNTLANKNDDADNSFSFLKDYLVHFNNGQTISTELLKDGKLTKGEDDYTFASQDDIQENYSVAGLDPGIYQGSHTEDTNHFYLNTKPPSQDLLAIISIDINHQSILSKNKIISGPYYDLHFSSIASYWQYYLSGKEKQENLVIGSSGINMRFDKTNQDLPNGSQAIVFTSAEKIPFHEVVEDYFRLKLRNGDPSNDLILISRLPIPDMRVLNKYVNGEIYTPIYVNY